LKVAEYLKTKKGFKVCLSVGFLEWNMKENKEFEEGMNEEIYVGTKSRVMYTHSDISSIIDDVIINFNKAREADYMKLLAIFKLISTSRKLMLLQHLLVLNWIKESSN
jgi:hypothetical protein